MKTFIKKLFLFLFIPLLVVLFMDLYFRSGNTIYKAKYNGALEQKDSIEIIALGNSQANYSIDPNEFKLHTYNLANVNQSIYFDKRITLSLLDDLKNLKFVLISVDYHSLYFSSQGHRNTWSYYGHGIKYKDSNLLLEKISPTLFGYTPKVAFSKIKKDIKNKIKYRNQDILDFGVEKGIKLTDPFYRGFICFEKANYSLFNEKYYLKKSGEFNNTIRKSTEKNEVYADLEDFIENLKNNNIEPILYSSPTYSEYNKYLDPKNIEQNLSDIKTLCDKYNIKYWDFMESEYLKKADYYNCNHLNKIGASKFSKTLNDSINSIVIK
jgi:hypothetical protein